MIHIKWQRKNNFYEHIIFQGHALYDDYGKDIVCAGVSAILTTTINGILRIQENALTYQKKHDNFEIKMLSKDEITQKLIENMICLLQELASNYPKNIKIESEEETC